MKNSQETVGSRALLVKKRLLKVVGNVEKKYVNFITNSL